jgi:hypothetical protein
VVTEVSQVNASGQAIGGRTNFEVHRRTQAGWEFRTTRTEMEQAIREAKRALELPGTEAVRVVRDHYDPVTKTIRPNTVFRATAPAPDAPRQPGLWAKLLRRTPKGSVAETKGGRKPTLAGSLTASLIGAGLGAVVILLHS